MGRFGLGKINKNAKQSKPTKPVKESPKASYHERAKAEQVSPDISNMTHLARVDELGNRTIKIVSLATIGLTVVLLGYFFTSDIREKIILAKTQFAPVVQAASGNTDTSTDTSDEPTNEQFSITTVPGVVVHIDRAEMEKYLAEMNDAEFKQFVESLLKASGSSDLRAIIDKQKSQDDSGSVDGEPSDEAILGKDGKPTARDNVGKTLEEAYAEAERQFPNQIDGSKRLKLIQDLNAGDYMYYVAEDGDTLLALSKAFGVPLGQLVELNGIHDADKIPAGMIILFPAGTEQPPLETESQE